MILPCFLRENILLFFSLLDHYSTISGLKVNKDKTQVLALNPLQQTMEFNQLLGFNSTSGPVSILGVDLFPNIEKTCNFDAKFKKIKNIISIWSRRIVSPFRKVVIIKTIILLQIIYLMSVLPNPSKNTLKSWKLCYFNFYGITNQIK